MEVTEGFAVIEATTLAVSVEIVAQTPCAVQLAHKVGLTCASVRPCGGSSARVTARKACSSAASTYRRSYVNVATSGELGYGSVRNTRQSSVSLAGRHPSRCAGNSTHF